MTAPTPSPSSVFYVNCPTCNQQIPGYWVYYPAGKPATAGRWQVAIERHYIGYPVTDPATKLCAQLPEAIT